MRAPRRETATLHASRTHATLDTRHLDTHEERTAMAHHDDLTLDLPAPLRELLEHACQLALEQGSALRPFALVRCGDELSELSLRRSPHDALEQHLRDLGPEHVDAYVAAWLAPDDDPPARLTLEAEHRSTGRALHLSRATRAHDDGTLTFTDALAVLPSRGPARLGAEASHDAELLQDPTVLLLAALVAIVRADGRVEPAEVAMLEGFAATVPALARYELGAALAAAREALATHGTQTVFAYLTRLPAAPPTPRQRLYVLAAELACVAGTTAEERATLDAIAHRLDLDDTLRATIDRVLRTKYERTRPLDRETLAATLMAAITADGTFDRVEMATLQALATTLPELAGREPLEPQLAAAQRTLQQHGDPVAAIATLPGATDPATAPALVTLAVELACASGGFDPREQRLITSLADILGVAPSVRADAAAVFAIKYSDD